MQASQRHFRQARRLLDLNPDPILSVAISHINPLAPLLYTYPTLPVLMGSAATGFSGTRADERSYRDWYFRQAWQCGRNYRAAGLFTRDDAKDLWPNTRELNAGEFATAKLLAQKLHFAREYVKHYYATLCDQIFQTLQIPDPFLGLCLNICEAYGVDFPMQAIGEIVHTRFASTACATERFWWWRLCYCRLIVLLLADVQKEPGRQADLWFPLFDEAVYAAIDVINAARTQQQLPSLVPDYDFESSVPDPSSAGECVHGAHFVPTQQTVPNLPFLAELMLGETTTASASPLFVLYKKTLFSPSQSRMLGSVVYKCMSRHPYAWPQLASIIIAVLLGNYAGSDHMQCLGTRAALVAMWNRIEHDGALQSEAWIYLSVFIGKCQTVLALLLRYSLLHAVRMQPALLEKISETLDADELWTCVSTAVSDIQSRWCSGCASFFNVCAPPGRLMRELASLEETIVGAYRVRLLELCVRKQPTGFLEALVKARKAQSPGNLSATCVKCPCHIQTQMQCFLDREKDAKLVNFLLALVRRLPPLVQNIEPLLIGSLVCADFPAVEVQAVCALIDAFYFRRKPLSCAQSKEAAFQIVLSHIRKQMPRAHAFVMTFASLLLKSRRFVIIHAPETNFFRRVSLSPCRVLVCPWCESVANESLFGGFSKLRVDTVSNMCGPPVYCCKASKSANTPPCSCGCRLVRETRACGQPDISIRLREDEILRSPTQLYMRCGEPTCTRIFGYAAELCAYSSERGGFLCPVCSMQWRRDQQKYMIAPAWLSLFDVRFDTKLAAAANRRSVSHATSAAAAANDPTGTRRCDLCTFGNKRYVSRLTPGASAGTAKKRRKTNVRQIVKLPGWEFELVLCERHLDEKEFLDDLGRCQLRVKLEPACTRQRFCDCDNGVTTCSGRMNLPSVIARWNMRQESMRASDYIAREYKKTPGLGKFVEDSRKLRTGEEVVRQRGYRGRPSRRWGAADSGNKRQRQ